ncbi:MAG: nucleotidyltransferase family protein [Clostridiaceae bacterium]|nr:nucleotidyltransferase family protein [Clostridiaceae bacterium]
MDEWEKALVPPDLMIYKVIELLDKNSQQIAVVTDEENRLLGTVTDGDIRRGILKKVPLNSPVSQIMNPHPITIPKLNDPKSIISILKANKVHHLPVIDEDRHVVGIERLDGLLTDPHSKSWVVIMAGGLGRRLAPLTDSYPKPMLKIGGRPVLQTILEQLIRHGFTRICISVSYRAEQIKSYFGDGSDYGAEIHYLEEEKRMGTAGSLSLFPFKTEEPILVINGDILTKLDFEQLIDFHREHQAKATIAVTTYDYQVPYGVVKASRDRLVGFEEKPVYASFINAGIYVLSPETLSYVPQNSIFDMTGLFEVLLNKKEPVCVFPVREYWIDIGGIKSFQKACRDYDSEFNQP